MAKEYFSQRDSRWGEKYIGSSKSKIKDYGCFGTALGNLCGKRPDEVFEILKNNGYLKNDLIVSTPVMAKLLGLEYDGINFEINKLPKFRTIAEVDMSPSPGKQQHFVVIKEDGSIIDSWTGTIRPKGTYPLVSYRLFKKLSDAPNETENQSEAIVELPEGDLIDKVAKACQIKEGWFPPSEAYPSGSISWRTKNPGNILWGDLAKSLGAIDKYSSPNGFTYAMWASEEQGFYALKVFLMLGFSGQLKSYEPEMTLKEFFKVYSGGGETYGQFVADKTGIPVETPVKYIFDKFWDTNN